MYVLLLYLFVCTQGQFISAPLHVSNATASHKRSVVVDKPSYIPLGSGQDTSANLQAAYQFVTTNLNPNTARFILYPYSFSTHDSTTTFQEGAIISTSADGLDSSALFKYYANDANITLQRAQALYDTSIAILQIAVTSTTTTPPITELTYEAYTYCSLLHDYLATKYETCFTSTTYQAYVATNPATREATSVVYVNETDVGGGFLFENGVRRFGVLVVPDIYAGAQGRIADLLGSDGQSQLSSFLEAGGTIFTSGKGALVLEEIGLVASATFDSETTFFASGFASTVTGCDIANQIDGTDDISWAHHALCFAPPRTAAGAARNSVTSAPLVLDAHDLHVLSYWDPSSGLLYTKSGSGVSTLVEPTTESTKFPHVLYGTRGKGQIIVNLANPAFQDSTFGWVFNALFVAMSEPLILDGNVRSNYSVIPALEQIALTVEVTLINLYNEDLLSPNYTVWVATGVSVVSPPVGCVIVNASSNPPRSDLDPTYYLDCTPYAPPSIAAFTKDTRDFKLQIVDVTITQKQTGIVLIYPMITYVQTSRNSRKVTLDYGPITTSAAMAALLTTEVNADPMGIWPVMGQGNYVDNVHYVINKENTQALDVVYTSILPLVTPFVDGSNQALVVRALEFDHLYYKKAGNGAEDYPFPFTNLGSSDRDYDYLDYYVLGNRSNIMVADWDTPTKPYKESRNTSLFPSAFPTNVDDTSVQNSQYASTVTSTNTVLKQMYFADSSKFYENATPRMLAFIDPSTPEGYATYNHPSRYPPSSSGLPSWMMNSRGTALRVNFLFGRNDIYFYNVTQTYAGADGVSNLASVFTVDRYEAGTSCSPGTNGAKAKKVVAGYFSDAITTSADVDSPPGMKSSEYNNELLSNCDRFNNVITPENINNSTNGKARLIHYIMRLGENPEIESGDDVMHFVKDASQGDWYYAPALTEGVSRFGNYPEVRIVHVWAADFTLDSAVTLQGGRITIQLPASVNFNSTDPVEANFITFSADKVAIVRTIYNRSAHQIVSEFKRGQGSDETNGANSTMQINLESLVASVPASFSAALTLEQLYYDISAYDAPTPYQTYAARPSASITLAFTKQLALSLPAVQLNHRLARGTGKNESYVQPLESIQPYARQGTYMQDLKAHRPLYSTAEDHPVRDPGVVPLAGTYSYITSIGISSIPFREYLSTGQKQLIPATATTSRVEWTDIWGRRWVEPVRSLFVDVAPLPGPLRNFMMTTTFELLRPDSSERVLQWQSDEKLVVRVQMKLKNNYSKWFDITACQANQIISRTGTNSTVDTTDRKNQMLNWNHESFYGSCWQGDPSILEAETLTPVQKSDILNVHLCAENQTFYEGCSGIMAGLPVLKKRSSTNNDTYWNYAKLVETHWPENYIALNMWDLTHHDYEDSPFMKSFPFHFDNALPSIDNGLLKPQNIIAFPVYKGLGYSIVYDKTLQHSKFPQKAGWWSDNLQNQDNTLVAGQATSNAHSVGTSDLTTDVGWVSIAELSSVDATSRLANIYVCEFNRDRIRTDPSSGVVAYPPNVVRNNVVPVDPSLATDDARYTSYKCNLSVSAYDSNSISSFDNYLSTTSARDWLYFGSNLRGEALENINVLYTLQPLTDTFTEGITKVQDGGRFVYWNPGLGPNAFEVVDDVPSVVLAQRTDLTTSISLFPTSVPTFNAVVVQWLHLEDSDEIEREWSVESYYNYYGFGDATVSVYVGGADGTSVIVNPGGTTIATIEFSNNAGFDWNLYGNAIESVETGSMQLSGNDLLTNVIHSIQVPTKYNFMTVQIPTELQPYIKIVPSAYFSETAPMVFDFSNINVATIQDGFKADYYYDITIGTDIPDEYKGLIHSFPITLNSAYFDALPGTPADPTGAHDYVLSIPPLVVAIPFGAERPQDAGKVFYTSGYAHNLVWSHVINPYFTPQAVEFVQADTQIPPLALIASNQVERVGNLRKYWANLTETNNDPCPFWVKDVGSQRVVYYNVSTKGNRFPFTNPSGGADVAKIDLLVYSEIPQLEYGWNTVYYSSLVTFEDDVGKAKSASVDYSQQVRATGAWLEISYDATLYNNAIGTPFDVDNLHFSDSGVAQLQLTAINVGSDIAYNVNFTLILGDQITVGSNLTIGYERKGNNLTLFTGFYLPPGTPLSIFVPLNFSAFATSGATSRLFVARALGAMDLTSIPGENTVKQTLDQAIEYPLVQTTANLSGDPSGYTVHLNLTTKELSNLGVTLRYVWWRRDINFHTNNAEQGEWYIIANSTLTVVVDKVSGQSSPKVEYMTTVHSANGSGILAQSNIYHFSPKPSRWWLVLVIALPIGVAILALLIAGFVYARRKHPKWFAVGKNEKKKPKRPAKPAPKSDMSGSSAGPSATPIVTEEGAEPITPAKKFTVNIDYLMTGARRVVVKDGNPSSLKPPEDYNPEDDTNSSSNNNNNAELDVDAPKTKKSWIRRLFPCL